MPHEVMEATREQIRAELETSAALDVIADLHAKLMNVDEEMKIKIFLEVRRGVRQVAIADRLGVSTSVLTKWKRQGEQAYQRRSGDLERPGEPVQDGRTGS